MNTQQPSRTVIGFKTALILYGCLILVAFLRLKGMPRYLSLVVVIGLAAKSYLHHLRGCAE